jgi:hypothetical protein
MFLASLRNNTHLRLVAVQLSVLAVNMQHQTQRLLTHFDLHGLLQGGVCNITCHLMVFEVLQQAQSLLTPFDLRILIF